MAALSNYAENKLLDHLLGTVAFTMPTQVHLALYTSDPTDADSGTEVSGGSYARQAVDFDAASGGATDLTADVTFPQASANWGTITHVGLRDAATGGNLLMHGALAASKVIDSGDTFRIAAADLDVALA
jgi:hypothetical protein